MSYTNQSFLWDIITVLEREQQQLISDLLISAGILYLAINHGANATFSVGALTIVNTVTVAQIIKAFREIQAQNRYEYTDEDSP